MNKEIKYFIWIFYIKLRTKEFCKAFKYLYSIIKIQFYKYLFKHCKLFAKYIREKALEKDSSTIILVELFLTDNWDLNDIMLRAPKKDREKFKELYNELIDKKESKRE